MRVSSRRRRKRKPVRIEIARRLPTAVALECGFLGKKTEKKGKKGKNDNPFPMPHALFVQFKFSRSSVLGISRYCDPAS